MGVGVSNGSLDFVSTLNNSDYQAKIQQDIKATQILLQLTGDTTAIEKYNQAVKSSLEAEIRLRAELDKVLQDSKAHTQQISSVQPNKPQTVEFDNIANKLNTVTEHVGNFQEATVEKLTQGSLALAELDSQLDAGKISAEQYRLSVEKLNQAFAFTAENSRIANQGNKLYKLGVEQTTVAVEEEIGILNILKKELKDLQSQRLTVIDPGKLAQINAQLEVLQGKIKNATRIGTEGFRGLDGAITKPVGTLARLQYAAKLFQNQIQTSTNPDIITKYNKKLQDTQVQIAQLSNVGKKGFDDLGNAVENSTNLFGKAFSAVRKLAYILPGIGIAGIFSFALGPILNYITKLDLFTGKTQALIQKLRDQTSVQNALNEARLNGAAKANDEIVNVNELYKATQNLKLSIQQRTQAAVELQNLYPTIFGNLSTEAILAGKGAEAYKSLKEEVLALANAEAIKNKVSQLATRELDDELKITTLQREQVRLIKVKAQTALDYKNAVTGGDETQAYAANLQATVDLKKVLKDIGDLQHDQNLVLVERTELEKRIDAIEAKRGTKVLTGGKIPVSEEQKNALESQKLLLQTDLDTQQEIFNNQTKSLTARRDALKKALADQLNIIKLSQQEDLLNLNISESAKKLIVQKYNEQRAKATAEFNDKIANLNERAGKTDSAIALLAQQTKVIQDIEALRQKAATKAKTRDEQAVDDVVATYNKQYDAAVAFNIKLAQFRKDNPGDNSPSANKLFAIDTSQIDLAKINALEALAGTQSVENTKNQVDQQKAIFKEYEAFKLQAGTASANELFGNELKGYKNYIDFLTNLKPKDSDLTSADPYTKARASALKDFIDVELPRAETEELVLTKKHLQNLIIQDQNYLDKRQTIIETGNEDIALLQSKGYTNQAHQVQKNINDQLQQLDLANFQKLDSYRNLAENIDVLTTQEAKKQVKNLVAYASTLYATGKISLDTFTKLLDQVTKFEQNIDSKIPIGLKNIGSALSSMGQEVLKFNEAFGTVLNTVGSVVSSIGDIKTQINSFHTAQLNKDVFGQISSGIGAFTSALSIIGAVAGVVDSVFNSKAIQAQIQYQQDLQVKSIEEVNKQLARQLELTKQVYGPQRISSYLKQLADIKAAEEQNTSALQNKLLLTGDKQLDAEITKVNAGQSPSGFFVQRIFELKQLGSSATTAGKTIEQLQVLLDEGKLDAKTAAIVQSLVDLQQQAIDTQNALQGDLLGTNFDTLLSDIDNLFTSATTSAEDFAKNFQKIIQQALLNSFNRQFLEKQLQKFYDDFFAISKASPNNVISKEDIAKLQAEYNDIIANAQDQFKNIENITGQVLTTPSTSATTSLAGGIQQAITEATATELVGTLHGIQLGVFDTNRSLGQLIMLAQDQLTAALQIQLNTKRTADNSDTLPGILEELKSITSNTAGTLNTELRAFGLN